jgi:predicted transcriptional regulator
MSATKAMTLRLSPDRAAELEAIARAEEMPVSDTVRVAIDKLIEEKRNDAEFQQRLRQLMDENKRVLERLAK